MVMVWCVVVWCLYDNGVVWCDMGWDGVVVWKGITWSGTYGMVGMV